MEQYCNVRTHCPHCDGVLMSREQDMICIPCEYSLVEELIEDYESNRQLPQDTWDGE
jgi:hypothetical protein